MSPKMNTVELIRTMATRPGMYIECTSADSIYSFIQGFYFCRSVHGELDLQDREFAESFYPWLKRRHGLEDAATWGGLYLAACIGAAGDPPGIRSSASSNVSFSREVVGEG